MSQQGAVLQNFNNELVKCIEELCVRRDDLQKEILTDEEEKRRLENDLRLVTEKLGQVNESLARKMTSRSDFDRTITDTEAAYSKILESSQTLLTVLKRDPALSSSAPHHPKPPPPAGSRPGPATARPPADFGSSRGGFSSSNY